MYISLGYETIPLSSSQSNLTTFIFRVTCAKFPRRINTKCDDSLRVLAEDMERRVGLDVVNLWSEGFLFILYLC